MIDCSLGRLSHQKIFVRLGEPHFECGRCTPRERIQVAVPQIVTLGDDAGFASKKTENASTAGQLPSSDCLTRTRRLNLVVTLGRVNSISRRGPLWRGDRSKSWMRGDRAGEMERADWLESPAARGWC